MTSEPYSPTRKRLNVAVFERLLSESGLSVREVARRAGVHHSNLSRRLRGELNDNLSPETVAGLYGVFPFESLFTDSDRDRADR